MLDLLMDSPILLALTAIVGMGVVFGSLLGFASVKFEVEGNPLSEDDWQARVGEWLPTDEDRAYVESLMVPCHEKGKVAGWIAPPAKGIDGKPFEFEYVKL